MAEIAADFRNGTRRTLSQTLATGRGNMSAVDRRLHRLRSALPLVSLLIGGCTLHSLPKPAVPDCTPRTPSALWECIDAIPREDRSESAFTSTLRVANPTRKAKDKELSTA